MKRMILFRLALGALAAGSLVAPLTAQSVAPSPGTNQLMVTTTEDLPSHRGEELSLRGALRIVDPGGTIRFHPELDAGTIHLGAELTIDGKVTIDASDLPTGLTISGDRHSRIFMVEQDAELSVRGVRLTDGAGTAGGALWNDGGRILIERCTFARNSVDLKGGAIYNHRGRLSVHDSTFAWNTAWEEGGAVANGGEASFDATHCTFSGNSQTGSSARGGGAISNDAAVTTTGFISLTHCTIVGNAAAGDQGGGGIYNPGVLVLENSIIAQNSSVKNSGADFVNSGPSFSLKTRGINLVQDTTGSLGLLGPKDITDQSPMLTPLGYYGGPTMTMHPLAGSPVIDPEGGASESGAQLDQRGFSRLLDGDSPADERAILDLGAVEAGRVLLVTTSSDENDAAPGRGAGTSLREAVAAGLTGGDRILIDPAVSGKLRLSREIEVDGRNLFLDASNRAGGLELSGMFATRAFRIRKGASLALYHFKIHSCKADGDGGAIHNEGRASITRTLITDNEAAHGGAISNQGPLTLTSCVLKRNVARAGGGALHHSGGEMRLTNVSLLHNRAQQLGGALVGEGDDLVVINHSHFSSNAASSGGAIVNSGQMEVSSTTMDRNNAREAGGALLNRGSLSLANSTLTDNTAEDAGAIDNHGPLSLDHVTICGNSAANFAGGVSLSRSTTSLQHSIVADNQALLGPDLFLAGRSGGDNLLSLVAPGPNLIGNHETVEETFPAGPLVGSPDAPVAPLLSAVGHFGGLTPTMIPLAGSPAIDQAGETRASTTDQRGIRRPVAAAPDLGAAEALAIDDPTMFVDHDDDDMDDRFEEAYGFTVGVQDGHYDHDADGSSNAEELRNWTNPRDGSDFLGLLAIWKAEDFEAPYRSVLGTTVRTFPGLRYEFETSAALRNFVTAPDFEHVADDFQTSFELNLSPGHSYLRVRRR